MDLEPEQTSAAEQRAFAVAKLKRAASLPRLKDGRRPPMHSEGVSEGEKPRSDEKADTDDTGTPEEQILEKEATAPAYVPEPESVREPEPEPELEPENEPETIGEEPPASPEPITRNKRRSRSRSRSRGSKDFKGKARATQSPTPNPTLQTNDSSRETSPTPPPPAPASPPLLSPIPSRFTELQRSRLLMSPAPSSPEPSLFYPGTSPPTPLPSLEALQRGLVRSNSAAARMMAMHKLTGGTETYEPSLPSPSPTPPSSFARLARNNTVSGGERSAARKLMLLRLGERIKEVDGDQTSGGEEIPVPITPKRRRRRSRRGSAGANTAVSDSEFLSTSPNTPVVPPTPLPATFDVMPDTFRNASATLSQSLTPPLSQVEHKPKADATNGCRDRSSERKPQRKRRSVVVEEDDPDEQPPPTPAYPGLPGTPLRFNAQATSARFPFGSDASPNFADNSGSTSGTGTPFYFSTNPPRQEMFPMSPFTTPLKEKPARDDEEEEEEEEVLYQAEMHRQRNSFDEDLYDRKISWIAEPVPRMPIDDDDEDEEDEREREEDDEDFDVPLSASSKDFPARPFDDESLRESSDSKDIVIEMETSPEIPPSFVPPSPSSITALSQIASVTRVSDGETSPQVYPTRLSVASPLHTDSGDWDDSRGQADTPTKRTADGGSAGTWEKVKSAFTRTGSSTGRRSRTNSIVTRERRDNTDSSVSRESGASVSSAKTDRADPSSTFAQQQSQQPLMQSPSASASVLSLSPAAPRGGVSPVPPATPADMHRYQNAKLFPFPGIKKLEEQRNRARGVSLSASTPDVTLSSNGYDGDQMTFSSSSNTPAQTPEMVRDRKLSHQASDTRLLAKFSSPQISASNSASSQNEYYNLTPLNTGSLKLPMNRAGVKQWLSAKRLFSSQTSPPSSFPTTPTAADTRTSPQAVKKPSLSDLLKVRKENEMNSDWEDINSDKSRTPTSAVATSGNNLLQLPPAFEGKEPLKEFTASSPIVPPSEHTDTEKTPKARKVAPYLDMRTDSESSYSRFDPSSLSHPATMHSPHEPPSSTTPDPTSSLEDYHPQSTSDSSSMTSSQYSLHPSRNSQGAVVLGRLDEMLGRGSRSPMWASAIEEPPRKLLLSSPVLQVVNSNTVKDRFLFLFNDLLVIAKPIIQEQDSIIDSYKPSPLDRKFIVKSVVLLRELRFSSDREEPQGKSGGSVATSRSPLIRTFVHQFSRDPDLAISNMFEKSGLQEDPVVLGQLMFRTLDLDRARLGDYLSRRTSKAVLKAYVDGFGFTGMRVDKALRVFLLSVNVPATIHNHPTLDYLLDAFASRWYEANATSVAYDRDLAIRLVRALVQLNDVLHEGIAQEPGPTGFPKRNVISRDFLEAFRRYDVRCLVSDELLENVYNSIRRERLCQARAAGGPPDVCITIKRALPPRLTYRVKSEPIILRIPQADPQLAIQLYGQDLIFDPPVLSFAKSSEASFRVTGTSLGPKSMIMWRSGPNALKYAGLPQSTPLVVERAFMRNTFQIAFLNHLGVKRRYMFSVDDPLIRHQWAVSLKRQIDIATSMAAGSGTSSPGALRFHRATELMAFKVLQEALIGMQGLSGPPPASAIDKALHRLTSSPRHTLNGSGFRFSGEQRRPPIPLYSNGKSNGLGLGSAPVRSKSRSKVYHQNGPGKLELELNLNGYQSYDEDDYEERGDSMAIRDLEQPSRVEGRLWSGRDLEVQCQQNSSIALVLAFLQVGAPDRDPGGS